MTDDQFRESVLRELIVLRAPARCERRCGKLLGPRISYLQGSYQDADSFATLREKLEANG